MLQTLVLGNSPVPKEDLKGVHTYTTFKDENPLQQQTEVKGIN